MSSTRAAVLLAVIVALAVDGQPLQVETAPFALGGDQVAIVRE